MNHTLSAFASDVLELTTDDLDAIARGERLAGSGLTIRLADAPAGPRPRVIRFHRIALSRYQRRKRSAFRALLAAWGLPCS